MHDMFRRNFARCDAINRTRCSMASKRGLRAGELQRNWRIYTKTVNVCTVRGYGLNVSLYMTVRVPCLNTADIPD